jgi:hypothetical protein
VIIARFRCGNEERENKYWNEDRTRVCRMCGEKKETIGHLLNECVELRERDESREEILNADGRGIIGKLVICYCFELLFYFVS